MEKAALGLLKCSLDRYIETRKEEGRPTALGEPESSNRPGRHRPQGVSRPAQEEEVQEQVYGACFMPHVPALPRARDEADGR